MLREVSINVLSFLSPKHLVAISGCESKLPTAAVNHHETSRKLFWATFQAYKEVSVFNSKDRCQSIPHNFSLICAIVYRRREAGAVFIVHRIVFILFSKMQQQNNTLRVDISSNILFYNMVYGKCGCNYEKCKH